MEKTKAESKPRVLFSYIEAGMGHIMPMQSIVAAFRKKYGSQVEIIESKFLQETGDEASKKLEDMFTGYIRHNNAHPLWGRFNSSVQNILGTRLPCRLLCRTAFAGRKAFKPGMAYIEKLNPDIVFSTHWVTQYYSWQLKNKRRKEAKKSGAKADMHSISPTTLLYCTDVHLHNLFRYPADYTMVFTKSAHEINCNKRQYRLKKGEGVAAAGSSRLVRVPFFIREEAFSVSSDKKVNRRALGFPEDKFTVVLAEGGYGIGRMQAVCEMLLQTDLPITVVPVCGKNEKLFEHFKTLKPKSEKMTFHPIGFNTRMLETIAAADLFVGKSGTSSIAEPTFFGVPSIVSGCTNDLETKICNHFSKVVGSAMKITNARKIVDAIAQFANNPSLLAPYIENAKADRPNYGAEAAADFLWEVCKQWSAQHATAK